MMTFNTPLMHHVLSCGCPTLHAEELCIMSSK